MKHKPYGLYEKYIKRPQDFLCALLALIILSPVMLITAVLVRIKLGSPVIFTQERPGRNGKIYKVIKFKTMTDERDADGKLPGYIQLCFGIAVFTDIDCKGGFSPDNAEVPPADHHTVELIPIGVQQNSFAQRFHDLL